MQAPSISLGVALKRRGKDNRRVGYYRTLKKNGHAITTLLSLPYLIQISSFQISFFASSCRSIFVIQLYFVTLVVVELQSHLSNSIYTYRTRGHGLTLAP